MTKSDDDILIERATAQVVGVMGDRPIHIETQLTTVFDLIAMVQLALRHPGVKASAPARRTERFIRDLIEELDPNHGDLWRLLSLGFDPEHDR